MEPLPRPPDGNQNRESALLAVCYVPFSVTVILVSARLFVRLRMKNMGFDDYSMFLSWLLYTIGISLIAVCMTHGGARHLYYLTPEERTVVLKYNFLSQPFGIMAPVFGKASVGLLMLKIMGPNTVWRKRFVYANLGIYMAISFLIVITTFVQCSPSRALWEMVPGSRCWNPEISTDLSIIQSAYGTYMDFVLALLPITIIRGLKMSLKQRIGLCILLSLGIFAGIAAAIKTAQLHSYGARDDFTWDTYEIFFWAPIEAALVIICGCIPAIKPIFDHIFKGTPVKPFRSYEPNSHSYQTKSNSKGLSDSKLLGRPRHWTNITHSADPYSGSNTKTDSSYNLQEIRVERGVEIDRSERDHARELEIKGNDVV